MATFQVPQFIDQKPHIIGSLTIAQFMYLVTGAAVCFSLFFVFSFFLWLLIAAAVAAVCGSLVFLKIDGIPLPALILHALRYVWQPRTYTWQRKGTYTTIDTSALDRIEKLRKSMGIQEKLKSLSLMISTRKHIASPDSRQEPDEHYQVVSYLTGEQKVAKKVDY